jgi:hypothetical protein
VAVWREELSALFFSPQRQRTTKGKLRADTTEQFHGSFVTESFSLSFRCEHFAPKCIVLRDDVECMRLVGSTESGKNLLDTPKMRRANSR